MVIRVGLILKFRKMKMDNEREKHERMKAEQIERAQKEEERRKQLEQEAKIQEMQHTPAKNHTQTITGLF